MRRSLGLLALALSLTACAGAHSAASSLSPDRATSAPPATQWVGTHGIELAVPVRWRLGRGVCGTPKANTVLWNEDGILTCATLQPPGLSVVEFGSILQRPRGWYRRHTTPVGIDGARARRWVVGKVDGGREVQLVFPRRGISVTVLSPHPALLHKILASARTVRADQNGCPTRPAAGGYTRGSRPSARTPFLPQGAVRMVGCSYKGRWLDLSNRIGRREAARLTRALNAAPTGFSHAHRGSVLPSSCRPSWLGSLIVARFEYPRGRPPITVAAHVDGCFGLGASNGRWAIRLRPDWVGQLVTDAHYAGDFLQYGE